MDNLLFTSSSKPPRARVNSALITLLTLLILFTTLETATRLFFTPCIVPLQIFKRFNPAGLSYGFDETETIFFECGERTRFVKEESVDDYPTKKTADDARIFTLGGSVSVRPQENNYSVLLEEALREQKAATNSYQVINGGINGYGTTRMLVMLKQILASNQKPDLLIIHPHGSNEFEDEVQLAYRNELLSEWQNRFLFQSRFFLVLKRVNQWITPTEFTEQSGDEERKASTDAVRVARWQQTYNANLAEMCRLANEANVPVIFLLRAVNPNTTEDNTFSDERTYLINQESYQHTTTCQKIYYLDTPQILGQYYPNPSDDTIDKLFVDSSHWRVETHKVVAKEIQEVIEAKNLLTTSEVRRQ